MTESIKLDYAPAQLKCRKRLKRILAMLLMVGVLLFAAIRWGPTYSRRAVSLYWQHRCMTYSPRAETVVYEEDSAEAAKLLARDSQYTKYFVIRPGATTAPIAAAALVPNCLVHFEAAQLPRAMV